MGFIYWLHYKDSLLQDIAGGMTIPQYKELMDPGSI